MFELLPNYFFVSTLIVALFLAHLTVYMLRIPERSSAGFHFGMALLWTTVISLSYGVSAGFYDPPMMLPRWLSILAAPLSLLHGIAFYFHFPMPLYQATVRRLLIVGYALTFVAASAVGLAMLQAESQFVFNAHFWDSSTPVAQRWFSYITLSFIFLLVLAGIWRSILETGRSKILLAVMTLGFSTVTVVPGTLHVLNLSGVIDRSTYLTAYSFLYLIGFFISVVAYINLSRDRSTIQMRIVTVTLVTVLSLFQTVSYFWLEQREKVYNIAALSGVLNPAYERPAPNTADASSSPPRRSYTTRVDSKGIDHHYVTFVRKSGDSNVEQGFDYLEYRRFVADSGFILLGITLTSYFFVLFAFRYFFHGALLQPIARITNALKAMRKHDYATRVPVQTLDEIGFIAHYFNRMARSIQASRRRLARYSDSLEEKIQERTHELETTLAEYQALHETKQELQQYATNLEKQIGDQDDVFGQRHEVDLPGGVRLIYGSRAMQTIIERVNQIATREEPVLITGETGTGKELIASLIHKMGRGSYPFVPVNCAAIPATLWESQIFGHTRGAFTDAKSDQPGVIAEAGEGTLFFDEIGEMPLEIQPKILRFIQERKYKPIGGRNEIPVRCRLLFATHRNLSEMVQSGDFREDLYYRVNVFEVRIPPLRERKSDVRLLIEEILADFQSDNRTVVESIEPDVLDALIAAPWRGNARELENFMIRILAESRKERITLDDLPPEIMAVMEAGSNSTEPVQENDPIMDYDLAVNDFSRRIITRALQQCSGNKSEAARLLGISRGKLQSQMRTLKMDD